MARTFSCTQCGTVDVDVTSNQEGDLCYECLNGEWHGMFEKERYDPNIHDVDNVKVDQDDSELGVESFG